MIFGSLQLSLKNVAGLQLDCKKFGLAACNCGLGVYEYRLQLVS